MRHYFYFPYLSTALDPIYFYKIILWWNRGFQHSRVIQLKTETVKLTLWWSCIPYVVVVTKCIIVSTMKFCGENLSEEIFSHGSMTLFQIEPLKTHPNCWPSLTPFYFILLEGEGEFQEFRHLLHWHFSHAKVSYIMNLIDWHGTLHCQACYKIFGMNVWPLLHT